MKTIELTPTDTKDYIECVEMDYGLFHRLVNIFVQTTIDTELNILARNLILRNLEGSL